MELEFFELAKEDKDVQDLIEDFYFSLGVGI